MRISRVETFILSDRQLLVKIDTDSGICGWGEATLESWVVPVAATVEQMANYLIGRDPSGITAHWQVLVRGGFYRGGPIMMSAVSGIDQALWDLAGHRLGAPIHELLGGPVRDSVRLYAHANGGERIGDLNRARGLVDDGFTMIKVGPTRPAQFIESDHRNSTIVRELEELRDCVGPEVDIAVDLHGRYSIPQSRRFLERTKHIGLAFVEEPLRPEHSAGIAALVASTSTPIATGERLYSRNEFMPVLEAGVAIVQPDLSHAGGVTETFRIGTQAEVYDAQLAPHCPLGPIAFAACIQIGLALPNVYAQETVLNLHRPGVISEFGFILNKADWIANSGYMSAPLGPGLGIQVDEDAVRTMARDAKLSPSIDLWWRDQRDGSYTEW